MRFGMLSRNGRGHPVAAESWDEDLWDLVTAEKLGFEEAWITEHLRGSSGDHLAAADLFIVKAAAMTKHMRFGPGIRPIPFHHPINVATDAAVTDHLTGGRYMAGFGGAGDMGDYFGQYGLDWQKSDKRAMMHEAIDLILKCWNEPEPFDFHGEFWHGERIRITTKPLQKPLPVGLAVSETASSAELAGRLGFLPLFAQYSGAEQLGELADAFLNAGRAAGLKPSRNEMRMIRMVHVADSVEKAKQEVIADGFLNYIHIQQTALHARQVERQLGRKIDDVTFEDLVDAGVYLMGDPDTVYQGIKDLYDRVGGFGVLLLHVGRGNGNRRVRRRSWRRFMEEVAPRLAGLDPDAEDRAQVPKQLAAAADGVAVHPRA